jgi:inward rectifier potassium channel
MRCAARGNSLALRRLLEKRTAAAMAQDGEAKALEDRPRSFLTAGQYPRRVRRLRSRRFADLDLYHGLLSASWPTFFAGLALFYVGFNLVFAGLYLLVGGIANARPGSFADAFFFSVQTMATIGYGQLYPQSFAANLLMAVEVLLGMSALALATGVIFARFSRPTARVLFSRSAVVAPYDGVPTLMFRAANQRRNQILEAQVSVSLLRDELTREGTTMRRFQDLTPVRARTPMFALTWTVMHRIDEMSPLYRATPESLAAQGAEIVITLIGLDATSSQMVHARHSYLPGEIAWNRRFADIVSVDAGGMRTVDYRRFHELAQVGD